MGRIDRARAGLGIAFALAIGVRALRVPLRWDETTWLYAAYNGETLAALREGRWQDAVSTFAGLHPPLYPLLQSGMEALAPIPLIWLLFSFMASVLALVASSRAVRGTVEDRALVVLVLGASPIAVAYTAEVNNYPLVLLLVAAAWWVRRRVSEGSGWWELALLGVLATWTHVLAGTVVGLVALTLGLRRAFLVLATMALAVVPLGFSLIELASDADSFKQPPIKLDLIWAAHGERFGRLWVFLVPAALVGARRRPELAACWLGTAGFVVVMQLLRIAAPHQFPYQLALLPTGALLVAAGAREGWSRRWVTGVASVQLAVVGWAQFEGILELVEHPPSAMTEAWERSRAGDAIYLVASDYVDDDDKRTTSRELWQVPPWKPMPAVRPYEFSPTDHRHGQPREVDGRVLYVNDRLRPTISDALAAHPIVWVVVADPRGRPDMENAVRKLLGPESERVGHDLLFRAVR